MKKGIKYDQEKAPLALIPPEAEEEEARVWQAGAEKYGVHNFRGGLSYLRILSALRRHTNAIICGEDTDPETGCMHAAHIRCCAAMLLVFKNRKDLDDRFVDNHKKKTKMKVNGSKVAKTKRRKKKQ